MSNMQSDTAVRMKRKSRGSIRLFGIGFGLLLIVAVTVVRFGMIPLDSIPLIPKPDLTTANSHVAIATAQLQKTVERTPRSADAWGQYGEILMAHEWNSEALICFERATQLNSRELRWPYLAAILLDRQEPTKALVKYDKAKEISSQYAPLWMRRGNTLMHLNRSQEAELSYNTASEIDKTQPQPLVGLARIAAARDDWKAAISLLENAKEIAPKNREVIVELTRARLMLGTKQMLGQEEQSAILSGEKYQAMPDSILESINQREVAARYAAMHADSMASEGDLQKAAEAYAALIKQRPELVRPRLNLASVFMASGQAPLALTTLQEVVRLFPDDPMGHYAVSYALESSQQFAAARREREKAIQLKPDYAEAHFALGLSAERDGEMDQAIHSFRLAIQSNARLAQAHLALGLAYQKQGQLEDAIVGMNAAVRLSPGDPIPKAYLEKAKALKATTLK